MEIFNKYGRPS